MLVKAANGVEVSEMPIIYIYIYMQIIYVNNDYGHQINARTLQHTVCREPHPSTVTGCITRAPWESIVCDL